MKRIRVLLSLSLLVAAASLASAGSFAPRTHTAADRAACSADMSKCSNMSACSAEDMSACPLGSENCPSCSQPCAPGNSGAATATVAVR